MIASLSGVLTKKSPDSVVVEAGGVGFDLIVPLPTLYELPEPGAETRLIVHTHVRENQILLVGFLRSEERDVFRLLTTVSGIGPRLAVNILSGLPATELLEAVLAQDADRLRRIPGVGKKMAERIVVELKDRIPPREIVLGRKEPVAPAQKQAYVEALSGLLNLGYKRKQAEKALEGAMEELGEGRGSDLERLLKVALQRLAKDT